MGMELDEFPTSEDYELEITESVKDSLIKMTPWIMFFSVLFFILTGLITLIGLTYLLRFNNHYYTNPVAFGVVFLVIGVVFLIPGILLFSSGKKISEGVKNNDVEKLEEGLKKQKIYWIFMGIFTSLSVVYQVLKHFSWMI